MWNGKQFSLLSQLLILFTLVMAIAGCDKQATGNTNPTYATGRPKIPPPPKIIYFHDGLARVSIGDDKTGKWGFIDKQGKFVINPQFDYISKFSDGLAGVRVGDDKTGKWGFIDKQGKFVINPQF